MRDEEQRRVEVPVRVLEHAGDVGGLACASVCSSSSHRPDANALPDPEPESEQPAAAGEQHAAPRFIPTASRRGFGGPPTTSSMIFRRPILGSNPTSRFAL